MAEARALAERIGRDLEMIVERMGLAALALTPDANVVTAIANDYGYDVIFSRQIQALGRAGDVAFGISTSGASRNVLLGLQEARRLGMQTVALTGRDGGTVGAAADVHINVPHLSTARVQEVHRTILHVLCGVVEERMCG